MYNMHLITPNNVKVTWEHFVKTYRIKLIKKENSKLMKTVGWYLDKCGYMTEKEFLNYFVALTIGKKRYGYVPKGMIFGLGSKFELRDQIERLPHELTHFRQKLGLGYIIKPYKRVKAETEAFLCNMEMHHYLTGNLYTAEYLSDKLKFYSCTELQIAYAYKKYEVASSMIRRGHYRQKTVKQVINFIQAL